MGELLYRDGILRVCTCAEKYSEPKDIQDCQRACAEWKKWDRWCVHYRTNGTNHCDYREITYKKKDDDY